MQPKPGSEFGIRLDQSQEPLASSVSGTTGKTRHFQKAQKDLSSAMKSARQLFHSGPLITTSCPDWLLQTGQGTARQHEYKSLLR